jgi:hypothetical protein
MPLASLAVASLAIAPTAAAQTSPPRGGARSEALRQRIEERFSERVKEELGLDDEQAERLRETTRKWAGKRRELASEQRQVRQSLAELRRSGGRDGDEEGERRLRRLLDLRVEFVETYRDELDDLDDFLTREQRVEFFRLRERLLARVQEVRERRVRTKSRP